MTEFRALRSWRSLKTKFFSKAPRVVPRHKSALSIYPPKKIKKIIRMCARAYPDIARINPDLSINTVNADELSKSICNITWMQIVVSTLLTLAVPKLLSVTQNCFQSIGFKRVFPPNCVLRSNILWMVLARQRRNVWRFCSPSAIVPFKYFWLGSSS